MRRILSTCSSGVIRNILLSPVFSCFRFSVDKNVIFFSPSKLFSVWKYFFNYHLSYPVIFRKSRGNIFEGGSALIKQWLRNKDTILPLSLNFQSRRSLFHFPNFFCGNSNVIYIAKTIIRMYNNIIKYSDDFHIRGRGPHWISDS
jgi:hypothetical protein